MFKARKLKYNLIKTVVFVSFKIENLPKKQFCILLDLYFYIKINHFKSKPLVYNYLSMNALLKTLPFYFPSGVFDTWITHVMMDQMR